MWCISTIFDFIGDFDKLTEMRAVCKEFKKNISKTNINALEMNEKNKYVLEKFNKQLIYLYCPYNDLKVLPELPNIKYIDCSWNDIEIFPDMPNCEYMNLEYNNIYDKNEYHYETYKLCMCDW